MKDIKWLKEEINKILRDKVSDGINYYDYMDLKNSFNELINQLDEPEVLSQEWIDENTYYVHDRESSMVYAIDLQNLLVPKQDVPVIPKFVADWIEKVKPDNSLRVAFEYIAQQKRDNHDDELAFWVEESNSETFARAWLDGYVVEEEQKYYVLNKELQPKLCKSAGMSKKIMESNSSLTINEKSLYREQYKLTEQEIKDYDERYWPFAIKVEELEE